MTAYGSAENAVEALKAGAFDYLTKPVDLKQFRSVVASAIQDCGAACATARRQRAAARAAGSGERAPSGQAGAAAPGRRLAPHAQRQGAHRQGGAQHGAGAGARRVGHRQGAGGARHPRLQPARRRPVRRGQLRRHPREPAGGRVLRHRKGAFTGADRGPRRLFQAARGGTLFLDEIGDLPLAMQVEAAARHPGAPGAHARLDAGGRRWTCASSAPRTRTWRADVQAGRFRQDLYYRLNVIEIRGAAAARAARGPAGAVRGAAGAHRAASRACRRRCCRRGVLQQLCAHPLRGNVRELENLLHRAVALSDGE